MKKNISKIEAQNQIQNFFLNIENRNSKQIKKIKRLAMKYNIKLKDKRKLFCKKCLTPYKNSKTTIKNKIKTILCKNCGQISRWKLKKES